MLCFWLAGTLGINVDLTPAGLIRFAIERGAGAGEDWVAFESRHRQVDIHACAAGF